MLLRRHINYALSKIRRGAAVRVLATEGLYGILGVTKTASQEEIRAAYKRLAHSLHPDKHLQDKADTTAAFVRCKVAYEILADRQKRQQYDEQYLHLNVQQGLHHQAHTPGSGRSRTSRPLHSSSGAGDNGLQWSIAAAAGAGSSGLSSSVPTAGSLQSATANHALMPAAVDDCHQQWHGTAVEAMQDVLLQHGLVLEHFHCMQEALEFLQQLQQQQVLLGLAAEDYLAEWSGQHNEMGKAAAPADSGSQQQKWGGFDPGEFVPLPVRSERM